MGNRLAFCLISKVRSKKSEGSLATQQCTGFNRFNGWMLREEVKREEVESEEVRGEKEDFSDSATLRLFPSPNSKFKSNSRASVREYKVTATG